MPLLSAGCLTLAVTAAIAAARNRARDLMAFDGAAARHPARLSQLWASVSATVSVVAWALMLWLVARRSGSSLTRDLF